MKHISKVTVQYVEMPPNHVRIGIALGLVLFCIGIVIRIIPTPGPLQIDPGPSSKIIISNGFVFNGLLVVFFSGIFWLRYLIANYGSVQTSEAE